MSSSGSHACSSIPGLTYPTKTFSDSMTVFLGSRAYDEARGINTRRIWSDKRDIEIWDAFQN